MKHPIRSAVAPLVFVLALTLFASCQQAEEPAQPEAQPRGVAETKQPPAEKPQPKVPIAAEPAPTPPPELMSDCFVFVDAEPDYGDAPLTANFMTELECDNKPVTYSWDFGDGTKGGNEPNPSHTYDKEGDYVATVTVTTEDGEVGNDEIDIFVDEALED
jgi:hypothetical protein